MGRSIAFVFLHVNTFAMLFLITIAFMDEFKDRVRHERIKRGLSQLDLAKRIGRKHQSYIANIESGRNKTSRDLLKLAKVFCVYPLWLDKGTGPKDLDSGAALNEDGIYVSDPRIVAIVRMLQQEEAPYLVEKIQKDLDADIELMRAATARAKANDC
jgi:transcriptional regulator with XRE-family HTH domain